jgi:hypothetical protein
MSTYSLISAKLQDHAVFMRRSVPSDSFLTELHCALSDTEWIPEADYKADEHRHPMNRLPIRPGLPFG